MKKVAIVQSNSILWKSYFDMIAAVDKFILYDDMQYTRRDWRDRKVITARASRSSKSMDFIGQKHKLFFSLITVGPSVFQTLLVCYSPNILKSRWRSFPNFIAHGTRRFAIVSGPPLN